MRERERRAQPRTSHSSLDALPDCLSALDSQKFCLSMWQRREELHPPPISRSHPSQRGGRVSASTIDARHSLQS